MSSTTRALGIARDLGLVVPRAVAGLNESTGWTAASPRGLRQFGEVMLDELVLAGFSLFSGGLSETVRPLSGCAAAAEELSMLGIDRAHADPPPLRVSTTRRRRIGVLSYEQVTFEHDPALPGTLEAAGLGVEPAQPPDRRLIVGAWHDRMAMREPVLALQQRWGGRLYWYDGSHVGHIFSRRV